MWNQYYYYFDLPKITVGPARTKVAFALYQEITTYLGFK